MDPTGQALLRLLFNEGETVCVSPNKFGYHSIPLETAINGPLELIPTENSLVERKLTLEEGIERPDTSQLLMCALNPISGFRGDVNCTAYRSFLIELDFGTLQEQLGTIKHVGMPFSAQVFSGSKSIHTVITLDEDLPDEKTYRAIAQWIFNIIPQADSKCKNPSRSVRIPGAYREPGKKQRLKCIKGRITHKELLDWLHKYLHLEPKVREKREVLPGEADFSRLSQWVSSMMANGVEFGSRGRNQTWYAIAMDFALAGFSEEETLQRLGEHFVEEYDFKEKEFETTVNSAFKRVEKVK